MQTTLLSNFVRKRAENYNAKLEVFHLKPVFIYNLAALHGLDCLKDVGEGKKVTVGGVTTKGV